MKTVDKAWGVETWLVNEAEYCAKYLNLFKGAYCSMHRHLRKKETFIILEGEVVLEHGLEGDMTHLKKDEFYTLEPGTWHRFRGVRHSLILEVSTHHDDEDVERLTESGMGGVLCQRCAGTECRFSVLAYTTILRRRQQQRCHAQLKAR